MFTAAVEHWERALAGSTSSRRAAIKVRIGDVYACTGDTRALPYRGGAARAGPGEQANEMALATANVGRFHHYRAQHGRAIEILERALSLAEPLDNPDTLSIIYSYLSGAYQHLARFEESDGWARRSIALGERHNAPSAIASGYEFLGENAMNQGRWRDALDAGTKDREIGERIGSRDRAGWGRFIEALALHVSGDLRGAEERARAGLAISESIGEERLAVFLRTTLALAETDLGRGRDGLADAIEAASTGERFGQIILHGFGLYAEIHARLATGDLGDVVERATALLARGESTDNRVHRIVLAPAYAAALLLTGRLDEAGRMFASVQPWMAEAEANQFQPILLRVEARRRRMIGEAAGAEAVLAEAFPILERLEQRLELARALRERAALRAERGEAAAGRADLERARALFGECGAEPERAAAESELAAAPAR